MRIYVAGKYSGKTQADIEKNVERAILTGRMLMRRGYEPFVPHLAYYINKKGLPISEQKWKAWGLRWLECCDVVLVISESPGVKGEINYAEQLGIPVCWSMKEISELKERGGKNERNIKDR